MHLFCSLFINLLLVFVLSKRFRSLKMKIESVELGNDKGNKAFLFCSVQVYGRHLTFLYKVAFRAITLHFYVQIKIFIFFFLLSDFGHFLFALSYVREYNAGI